VDNADGLEVGHDPREVFEVAPEGVKLPRGFVDRAGLLDVDGVLEIILRLGGVGVRGVNAEGVIELAVTGDAAPSDRAGDRGEERAGKRLARQPSDGEGC